MREADQALTDALTAPERTVRVRLSVDWDADGHGPAGSIDDLSGKVASLAVTSVLTTTTPEEVAVVEGNAAATATASLAAGSTDTEILNAVRYFSPLTLDGPLAGKERLARDVEVDAQILTRSGWQAVPILRGTTRALAVQVSSLSADLSILDYRSRLRELVELPPMVADAPATPNQASAKPGMEGTWIVSYVMYQCGEPVSPAPPAGCRYFNPLHGSAMPFVTLPNQGSPLAYNYKNTFGDTDDRRLEFVAGPHLLATRKVVEPDRINTINVELADGTPAFDSNGRSAGRVEYWMRVDGDEELGGGLSFAVFNLGTLDLSVNVSPGFLSLNNDGDTRNIVASGQFAPADGRWHQYGVWWDDSQGRAVFRFDETYIVRTWTPTTASGLQPEDTMSCGVNSWSSIAEFMYSTGVAETDPWTPRTHDGPRIDRSALRLDGITAANAAEGYALLTELAAAELGAVFRDGDGRLHYATRARLISDAAQTVQREITAAADIFEAGLAHDLDRVRNIATCQYSSITLARAATAWELDYTLYLPAGASVAITFQAAIATTFYFVEGMGNSLPDGSGTQYFINFDPIDVVVTRVNATQTTLTITNRTGVGVWMVDNTGANFLRFVGDVVSQASGVEVSVTNQASRDRYGPQPIDLGSSRWVQRADVALGLAMSVGLDLGTPAVNLAAIDIPGDPRLEFYDRVRVVEPMSGVDSEQWVIGRTHSFGDAGYGMQLTTRPARTRYLAGVGIVGEDVVG